jgi:hypothetical protein
MKVSLFILDADQKRKLIEIMIIVFSIMVILPSRINITSNMFGVMPALFLFLSIFYWIASHDERTNNNFSFKLVALIISFSFSIMLSAKIMEFFVLFGIFFEMISLIYYLVFTAIIYLALTTSFEDKGKPKLRLKPFGKIVFVSLLLIFVYLLAKFF